MANTIVLANYVRLSNWIIVSPRGCTYRKFLLVLPQEEYKEYKNCTTVGTQTGSQSPPWVYPGYPWIRVQMSTRGVPIYTYLVRYRGIKGLYLLSTLMFLWENTNTESCPSNRFCPSKVGLDERRGVPHGRGAGRLFRGAR